MGRQGIVDDDHRAVGRDHFADTGDCGRFQRKGHRPHGLIDFRGDGIAELHQQAPVAGQAEFRSIEASAVHVRLRPSLVAVKGGDPDVLVFQRLADLANQVDGPRRIAVDAKRLGFNGIRLPSTATTTPSRAIKSARSATSAGSLITAPGRLRGTRVPSGV